MVDILFQDPFLKSQNRPYVWVNNVKFYTVCFQCIESWRLSKYIETNLETAYFYFRYSFSKKTKRFLKLVYLPHFLDDIWRKMFIWLYCINWLNLFLLMPVLREILWNMCFVIVCQPGFDIENFEINLIVLLKPSSSFFNGFQLPEIVSGRRLHLKLY